jgi:hypothetical protein
MTATTIVSLKNAGDSITIGVESCRLMEVGRYPEVEFVGQDGNQPVAVRVPKQSCDRQMERAGVATYADFVGRIVTISRDPNRNDASKPYWGIRVSGSTPKLNGTVHHAASAGLPDEPPPVDEAFPETSSPTLNKLNTLFGLYRVCFDEAASIAKKNADLNLDVSAMAATLFIQATQRGIVPL